MSGRVVPGGAGSNTAPQNYKVVASQFDYLTVSVRGEGVPLSIVRRLFSSDILVPIDDSSSRYPALTNLSLLGFPMYLQVSSSGNPVLRCDGIGEVRCFEMSGRFSVQASLYSAPFWSHSPLECANALQDLISSLCPSLPFVLVPVRVDLCRDVVGYDLQAWNDSHVYDSVVSRSRSRKKVLDFELGSESCPVSVSGSSRSVQSVYLGSRNAPVLWNIYNKSLEVRKSGKSYYDSTWVSNGWSGENICRFEVRLSSKFLGSLFTVPDSDSYAESDSGSDGCPVRVSDSRSRFSVPLITDVFDLINHISSVWSFLTFSHTRFTNLDDSNVSRRSTNEFWASVMQLPFVPVPPQPLIRRRFYRSSRESLGAQIAGCLVTYAAITDGGETWSIEDVSQVVLDSVECLIGRRGAAWRVQVTSRRAERAASLL